MPHKLASARRSFIRTYMRKRRAAQREQAKRDATRYLSEATFAFASPNSKLHPFVAMIIWRDAASGFKPAQATLRDPRIAAHVGRMLIRAWTRQILGWAVQLPVPASLAESTTPEVRRVAHLVDQSLSLAAWLGKALA